MKKIIILLFLLLTVTSAVSAQSLFPMLSTPTPEPSELAPSYSGYSDVEPDEEKDYGADGTVVSYFHVTEKEYLAFGDYLAALGFEAVTTNVNGRTAELILNDGKFNIGISYNADDEILLVIYEDGVDYQKADIFPGYKRITFSDTLSIPNWAEIRFRDFQVNKPRQIVISDTETWIMFSFYNKSGSAVDFNSRYQRNGVICNDIARMILHYINDEGHYTFAMDDFAPSDYDYLDNKVVTIQPMINKDLVVGFGHDAAPVLQNSTDGMLAVTFDFVTGDKYVLILRENGIDIR